MQSIRQNYTSVYSFDCDVAVLPKRRICIVPPPSVAVEERQVLNLRMNKKSKVRLTLPTFSDIVGAYFCGCRITAITPAFQAGDEGSTPFIRLYCILTLLTAKSSAVVSLDNLLTGHHQSTKKAKDSLLKKLNRQALLPIR